MEPRTALAGRLAPTIKGLALAIGLAAARHPALIAILRLLYFRVFALVGRIDRLAVRFRDGILPKPRHRAPKPSADQDSACPAAPRLPAIRLPTGRGWLHRLAQPVAQWAPHVEIFVNHPDTMALAAATPQAGRLLRPLCRLLLVPIPAHLRLPPRPVKPRIRTPKPRPAPLPPLSSHTPAPAGTGILTPPPDHLRLRVPGLKFRPPDPPVRRFRPV